MKQYLIEVTIEEFNLLQKYNTGKGWPCIRMQTLRQDGDVCRVLALCQCDDAEYLKLVGWTEEFLSDYRLQGSGKGCAPETAAADTAALPVPQAMPEGCGDVDRDPSQSASSESCASQGQGAH